MFFFSFIQHGNATYNNGQIGAKLLLWLEKKFKLKEMIEMWHENYGNTENVTKFTGSFARNNAVRDVYH